MTINEYLAGLTAYSVPEEAYASILYKVGVEGCDSVDSLTLRQRELCEAHLYAWCALQPTTTGSTEDSDGGWTHREGAKQVSAADKANLLRLANAIFRKYGVAVISSMKIKSMGMRMFPQR